MIFIDLSDLTKSVPLLSSFLSVFLQNEKVAIVIDRPSLSTTTHHLTFFKGHDTTTVIMMTIQ